MIRQATEKDLPSVTEIYERIHDEEESGRLRIGWIRSVYPTEATARAALERGELYVAEQNGAITGSAVFNRLELDCYRGAPWQQVCPEGEALVMHTLTVSPAHFRRGIGGEFVHFYEVLAARNRCRELRIDTQEKNTAARAMYRKYGFTEIGTVPCVFNGIPDVRLVLLEKSLTL